VASTLLQATCFSLSGSATTFISAPLSLSPISLGRAGHDVLPRHCESSRRTHLRQLEQILNMKHQVVDPALSGKSFDQNAK
jgi:hypothetical protein